MTMRQTHPTMAGKPTLQIFLLGSFQVVYHDQPIAAAAWKRRKAKTLLKLLAMRPTYQLHYEEVIDLLWPTLNAADGRNNLDRTIYYLRRTLAAYGPPQADTLIGLHGGIVRLHPPERIWIDMHVFQRHISPASVDANPIARLEAALEVYRGPLLEEDRNEEWVIHLRDTLTRLHHEARQRLATEYYRHGQMANHIALLRQLIAVDPIDEQSQRALIAAYAGTGRRKEAIQHYQEYCELLANELNLEPEPETSALYQRVLAGQFPGAAAQPLAPPAPQSAPPRPLPLPRTSFIGRDAEINAICDRIRQPEVALLTILGPPGVGKTRLALQCMPRLQADFPDGMYWVSLASIDQADHVIPTVLQVIGAEQASPGGQSGQIPQINRRRILLMLDNFEHLARAAAAIADLLRANPLLKILVTSRTLLQVSGEHVVALAPFPLTAIAKLGLEAARTHPAVQLFVARAQLVLPDFQLNPGNLAAVLAICVRLDGLPLAIELAAVHIRSLTPELLLARLEHRLQFLTLGARDLPDRQQALRTAIDWSYDLLEPAEQALFARLGVFAGGFSLKAIEAICTLDGQPIQIVHALEALVDKSLLQRDPQILGESRFFMLETIREYAIERLQALAERSVIGQAHAMYYLAFAATAEQGYQEGAQSLWLRRIEQNHDNLRAAIRWTLLHQPDLAVRLCQTLATFWQIRGYWREGYTWLVQALVQGSQSTTLLRAKTLLAAGRLGAIVQDYQQATRFFAESLACATALADALGMADARVGQATLWINRHLHAEESVSTLEECLALYRQLNMKQQIAEISILLMRLARHEGYPEQATSLAQQGLALARESGDRRLIAEILHNLAHIMVAQGNLPQAMRLFTESLHLERELGNPAGIAQALAALGLTLLHHADHAQASKYFEESLALRQSINDRWAIALSYDDLARAALLTGKLRVAADRFKQSIQILYPMNESVTISYRLDGLAWVSALSDRSTHAARLAGAADQLRAAAKKIVPPIYQPHYQAMLARIHSQLSEAEFGAAWNAGQAMAFEQLVGYALEYPAMLE
jgi:predicted ATPase/DNA-binding SARP family transcriptional activator